jgi:autophagy-related protein 2
MVAGWALKRAFKFVLKKALGPVIKGDVDLEQLDVDLTSGRAELRGLLLDTDHINSQLQVRTPSAPCTARAMHSSKVAQK